jgi:hypothetical protein
MLRPKGGADMQRLRASVESPVVDELQPQVTPSWCFVPKTTLSCVFVSRQFSSLYTAFGAHVPWMCPISMSRALDFAGVGRQSRDQCAALYLELSAAGAVDV